MNLDPSEWYFFELVSPDGTIADSGYATPRHALAAAVKTGTRAHVRETGFTFHAGTKELTP